MENINNKNDKYTINIQILDKSDFISPYCGSTPVIVSEVDAYLSNALKSVSPMKKVEILIKSNETSNEAQELYKSAIINYYSNFIKQHIRDLIYHNILSIVLLILGATFIALMLASDSVGIIVKTIFEIIGWVLISEATYNFFFERHKIRVELIRARQIKNATIVFE